jgi:hypothetical protein
MAIDQESFNKKLYDLLKTRGYRPIPKDSKNERTESPQDADVFNFTFVKAGEELGDAWVTIDDAQDVILYYDDDIMDTGGRSKGSEYDDSWTAFIQHLKRWAMSKQLGFELRDKNKLGDDMAQREYTKKKENISEGYYPMGKQSSYSDAVPTVKIILQHTRQIQEGEQRYRNIARIFLENQVGERILAPTTRPGVAQVYARHLAEGGVPNDERWNHIKGLCEEYQKMAGFVRATRGNQFNESAQRLVNEGINHYHNLRETLGKMRGHRGYHKYFESYTPALMETEGDETNLTELFVQETLDPRIESVMPILSRLQKNVSEMREVNELAEWASSLLEGGDGPEASEENDVETAGDAGEGGGEDAPEDDLMEAPGAETLAHNQNTEKGNLKAFDLEEDSEDTKLSRKLKANIDNINSKLKDPKLSDEEKKDLKFKLKIYSDRLGKKKDSQEPDSHYSSDTKQSQIAQAAHERVRKVEKKTAGDLVHDVTGLEEDNEPYEDMSDIELIRLCNQMGLGKSCVRDGEGQLANRDEVVSLLKSQDDDLSLEGVAEGSGKNVVKSVKVGNFRHDLVDTGFGWQVRIYNGDELYDTGLSKNSEQKGLAALDDAVAYTKKQLNIKEQGVAEDLDANQKRVGQLGPTEKVKNNNIGKLVGASESTESKEEAITEMDSEGYKGHREDGDPYAKGSKATPSKTKDTAKDAEKVLNKEMDKAHKKDVKEGQEDLEAILRLLGK